MTTMSTRRLAMLVVLASMLVSGALLWSRRDYVPLFDGRIYADCIANVAAHPGVASNYRCAGHISESYVAILMLAGRIAPASPAALMIANALLLVLGAGALWRLLRIVFPGDEHQVGRAFVLGTFLVHPIVLASVVQPGLDTGLLVFSLLALAAAVEGRRWTLVAFGILLIFSKEPGVVLYGVIVAAWLWRRCARLLAPDEPYRLAIAALGLLAFIALNGRDYPSAVFFLVVLGIVARRPRGPSWPLAPELGATLRSEWPLVIPVLVLAAYFAAHMMRAAAPEASAAASGQPVVWGGGDPLMLLVTLIRPGVFDPQSRSTFALMFVVGFLWLPTLILLVDLAHGVARYVRGVSARSLPDVDRSALAFITLVLLADVWLLSRFRTYSNARYYLPIFPLVLLVAYASLVRLGTRPVTRGIAFATIGVVLAFSAVRTVDPVSRALWGTFRVGDRSLLRVTSIANECCGHGRDQLVYNLEFTEFATLQDALFEQIKPTAHTLIVVPYLGDWFTVELVDSTTHHRTLRTEGSVRPKVLEADVVQDLGDSATSAWFVETPYSADTLARIVMERRFGLGPACRVTHHGYTLTAREISLRRTTVASPSIVAPGERGIDRAPDCAAPAPALSIH
jgi:hypothetical protein